MIGDLFAVEADMRGRSPQERCAARQARSAPLLAELRTFLDATLARISGKSDFAKAIRRSTARWTALTRFVENGGLEMSNNAAERAMRPPRRGRGNYLFAGSDADGARPGPYTPIETARLNGVDPMEWIADVIARSADRPINQIDDTPPWNWTQKPSQAKAA